MKLFWYTREDGYRPFIRVYETSVFAPDPTVWVYREGDAHYQELASVLALIEPVKRGVSCMYELSAEEYRAIIRGL